MTPAVIRLVQVCGRVVTDKNGPSVALARPILKSRALVVCRRGPHPLSSAAHFSYSSPAAEEGRSSPARRKQRDSGGKVSVRDRRGKKATEDRVPVERTESARGSQSTPVHARGGRYALGTAPGKLNSL